MSLEKIAANQPLTREDVVAAAYELAGLEKEANDADAQGRQMAHEYFDGLVKQAAAEESSSSSSSSSSEDNSEVKAAIATLKKHKVIPE